MPFDPAAWRSDYDDVFNVCKKQGWGCEGHGRTLKPREPEPVKKVPIAPDIVDNEVKRIEEEEAGGKLPKRERRDLKEKIAKRFAGEE